MKEIKLKMAIYLSIFCLMFGINSCAYKPVSYYAKNEITNIVYVNVDINAKNSQYTPILKDSINEMLINKFKAQVVDEKSLATTIVNAKIAKVSFSALQTNTKGFANFYRAQATIEITYDNLKSNHKKTFTLSDYYDYSVDEHSITSQKSKENAVRMAIIKSLNNLFSTIAINSI